MPSAFRFVRDDVVLVQWNDDKIYYAKIKRIDLKREKCTVEFDDKSVGEAKFSQIFGVEETTTDWIVCIICKSGSSNSPDEIILCDQCELGYHQNCHDPRIPLAATQPNVPWQCTYCTTGRQNPHTKKENNPFQERKLQLAKVAKRKRLLMNKTRDSPRDAESPPLLRSRADRNSPSDLESSRRGIARPVIRSEGTTEPHYEGGSNADKQTDAAAREGESCEESNEPAAKRRAIVRLADCVSEGAPTTNTRETDTYVHSPAESNETSTGNNAQESPSGSNGDLQQQERLIGDHAQVEDNSIDEPEQANETYRQGGSPSKVTGVWPNSRDESSIEGQVDERIHRPENASDRSTVNEHVQHAGRVENQEESGGRETVALDDQRSLDHPRGEIEAEHSRNEMLTRDQRNLAPLHMDVNQSNTERWNANAEHLVDERERQGANCQQVTSPQEPRKMPDSTRAPVLHQVPRELYDEQLCARRDPTSTRSVHEGACVVTSVKTEPNWDYHSRKEYPIAASQARHEPQQRAVEHVRTSWMYPRTGTEPQQLQSRYTRSPTPNVTTYHRASPDLGPPHSPRSPNSLDSYRRRRGTRGKPAMARWSPPGRYVAKQLGEPPLFVADPYMSVADVARHGDSNPNAVISAPVNSHGTGSRMDQGRLVSHPEAEPRSYPNSAGVLERSSAVPASAAGHSIYSQQAGPTPSHSQTAQYVQIGEMFYQVVDQSQRSDHGGRASYGTSASHRDNYEQAASSRHTSVQRRQERSTVPGQRPSGGLPLHEGEMRRTLPISDNIVARIFNAPVGSIEMVSRDPNLLELDHMALTDMFNHHCGRLFETHRKLIQGHHAPSQPTYSASLPPRRTPTTANKPPVVQRVREAPSQVQVQPGPAPSQMSRSQHLREQPKPPAAERERSSNKHLCVSCRKPALMVCSMCQRVWYCGRECQLKAWKTFCANCG